MCALVQNASLPCAGECTAAPGAGSWLFDHLQTLWDFKDKAGTALCMQNGFQSVLRCRPVFERQSWHLLKVAQVSGE